MSLPCGVFRTRVFRAKRADTAVEMWKMNVTTIKHQAFYFPFFPSKDDIASSWVGKCWREVAAPAAAGWFSRAHGDSPAAVCLVPLTAVAKIH